MSTYKNLMDQMDHIGNRVTTCTLTGLIIGASTATYNALPLFQTSVSIAGSFALTSTACLIPQRILYSSSFYFVPQQKQQKQQQQLNLNLSPAQTQNEHEGGETERRRLIASHIGGGMIGGTISGSLYQRRFSWTGMVMFTPIMIGIAFAELNLQEYRRKRLNEIAAINNHR